MADTEMQPETSSGETRVASGGVEPASNATTVEGASLAGAVGPTVMRNSAQESAMADSSGTGSKAEVDGRAEEDADMVNLVNSNLSAPQRVFPS